jgi:hypothetical protein
MTITAIGQSESCEGLQDRREVREESEVVDYVHPNEPEAVYDNSTRDGAGQPFSDAKHDTIRLAPYSISDRPEGLKRDADGLRSGGEPGRTKQRTPICL